MEFFIIPRGQSLPQKGKNAAYLRIDNWNDYSFVTMFDVVIFDFYGKRVEPGSVKIGFSGQSSDDSTHSRLDLTFANLPDGFFSLGQDVSYYETLVKELSPEFRENYLSSILDVASHDELLQRYKDEQVFGTSLLRGVSLKTIIGQFRRVLKGGAALTDYNFSFYIPGSKDTAELRLEFIVKSNSTPSTNAHALIGRNGVGKTTILNKMIESLINKGQTDQKFVTSTWFMDEEEISEDYFSSLLSISFSAFDPFVPPRPASEKSLAFRHTYVGLKDIEDDDGVILKSLRTLREECVRGIQECFSDEARKRRWTTAIQTLESDENFARMNLRQLASLEGQYLEKAASKFLRLMSSGHAIVLLTISQLVAKLEEKTLVLFDEPESHLHPPLLSAFTRALIELLFDRNGVAIIATHSPVVLQELPKSCVQIITRAHLSAVVERPKIETFGENVGALTREVFGLEVVESGYHSLLKAAVDRGSSYDEILYENKNQLGLEARGILRAMISHRDVTSGPVEEA